MSSPRLTSPLELVQMRLASEHDHHGTGPIFPCPLCFQPALSAGAVLRPYLLEPAAEAAVDAGRPQAAAA